LINKKNLLQKPKIAELQVVRRDFLFKRITMKSILTNQITDWEELMCVGYNPELSQLMAIISIKRQTGYSGGLCSNGSTEYVRFFIDWGQGDGFQDVGITSFKAHNIPDDASGSLPPLKYMVYLPLDDEKYRKCCNKPVIVKVRAVLSWNEIPSLDPNDAPYFGNVLDANIQISPKNTLSCLLQEGLIKKEVDILQNLDLNATLPMVKPVPVPLQKLLPKYKEADIPDHRTLYSPIVSVLKGDQPKFHMSAKFDPSILDKFKIDIDKVKTFLLEEEANTSYEELICVGLNTSSDTLGAVVHVKRPLGYGGNLCEMGTEEYIAFWADWNNDGNFDEYLGTVSIKVHDITSIPDDGLYYSVPFLANFTQHLRECSNPNIIKIRAVLSWNVPPSIVDPDTLNTWGNLRTSMVQIRSGSSSTELMSLIYDVGGVPIEDISSVTYLAYPSLFFDTTSRNPACTNRPFGGNVHVRGRIYNTGAPRSVHFQVQYSKHGTSDWLPVCHDATFELMYPDINDPLYPMDRVTINSPDGWFPYLEDPTATPPIFERLNRLSTWNTGSLEGVYDIRVAYTEDYPITPSSVIHYSEIVTITLDNTGFSVSPTANVVIDTNYSLDLILSGGDCRKFAQGTSLQGKLRALNNNFWRWRLELQPKTHYHGHPTDFEPFRNYDSLMDQGDAQASWSLPTNDLDPCGYTLTLWAYDRTIVNSSSSHRHWNKKAIGFSIT
jgi:hypothetical protein